MPQRQQDKTRILEALRTVFVARGYDGATLGHLAQACGLSKASLYHHFPNGKPEMAALLVRHAIAELHRLAFSGLGGDGPPERNLFSVVAGFSRYVEDGARPCILATFAQQVSAHDETLKLQKEIERQFADWHTSLSEAFRGTGYSKKRARREAHGLIGQLYGALMNAKLHGQPGLFNAGVQQISKRLEKSLSR